MDYPAQERNFEENRKGIVIQISFVCGTPLSSQRDPVVVFGVVVFAVVVCVVVVSLV